MDELIREVMERTGLPEDQARAAAEAVAGHFQRTLSESAAHELADLLNPAIAPEDPDTARKATIAAVAATTAAVSVVVLPGAHH
jgi:hypothetical protein